MPVSQQAMCHEARRRGRTFARRRSRQQLRNGNHLDDRCCSTSSVISAILTGKPGWGPDINAKPAPRAVIRLQVRSGLGAMPAFPDALIPDQDLNQLLAFVDAQRNQSDQRGARVLKGGMMIRAKCPHLGPKHAPGA